MGRYVVTGCAGFVGSHLAEALLELGDEVRGVDAFSDYYERERKEANLVHLAGRDGFTLVEADLASMAIDELLEGVDGVFHLAAQPGVRGSWGETFAVYARDNLVATQRTFEAAAARGLRCVWASSSSVYGDAESYPTPEETPPRPISPYGVTKLSCEHLAGAYAVSAGLDAVALRYFTVYGPRQRPDMAFTRIVTALASDTPFHVFGDGRQSRDVTYVADAVAATIGAMERGVRGAVYNVGGGSETSLRDVLALCERLSGRTLDVRYEPAAAGDVRRTAADTTAARRDLGWEPATTLEQGLREQLAWAGISPI
jgi:UDP-glucuronate 4-epimerase